MLNFWLCWCNQQCEQLRQLSWLAYVSTCRYEPAAVNQILHRQRPVCRTWLATVYEMWVTKILEFFLRGLTVGQQNSRWPATHLCLLSRDISSPCVNPRPRYPLQKICGQKQTLSNISHHAYRHVGIIIRIDKIQVEIFNTANICCVYVLTSSILCTVTVSWL